MEATTPSVDWLAMAERKRAESETAGGFTAEEQGVIEESAPELRRSRRSGGRDDAPKAEREVLAKIAEMQEPDRVMAERLHAVIRTHAPSLVPRTWYGMPAYARGGKVVCFFQGAH